MTVARAFRLRTGRIASICSVAAIVLGGTLALAPSASAVTPAPVASPVASPAPAAECASAVEFDGTVTASINDEGDSIIVSFPAARPTSCFDRASIDYAVAIDGVGILELRHLAVPAEGSAAQTDTFVMTEPGDYDVTVQTAGYVGDVESSRTTVLATTVTASPTMSCPTDGPALGLDEGGFSSDWSVPGIVTVTLPQTQRAECLEDSYFSLSVLALNDSLAVPSVSTVGIPAEGYPGGTLSAEIPYEADWRIVVTGTSPGAIPEEVVYLDETRRAYPNALAQCLAGGLPIVADGTPTAVREIGAVRVTLPSAERLECLDSAVIRVWAEDWNRPNEMDGFTSILLDEIAIEDFAGITKSYPVPDGHVDVTVTVEGTLDGDVSGREFLARGIHLVEPTAAVVPASLASTGTDAASALYGAAALLAAGLAVLLVPLRRRRIA